MNFKRRKTRRRIRCSICTPYRWMGNSKERHKKQGHRPKAQLRKAIHAE